MIATVAVLIVILAGMQTMQIQNVALAVSPSDDECPLVPCWIKNTAGYWVEGSSTTVEYLYSIEWLIDEGIITLDTVSAVSDSEDLSTEIADIFDMIWEDRDRLDVIESFLTPPTGPLYEILDYSFTEAYDRITDLESDMASHNIRIDSLEEGSGSTSTSSIEDELEDISDRISDLEDCNGQGPDYKQHLCEGTHELEELESDIAELFAKFDMLDSDISDLLKEISKIERDLGSLEKSVDKLDSHKDKESDKSKP
jgi:archaellum component FlaC